MAEHGSSGGLRLARCGLDATRRVLVLQGNAPAGIAVELAKRGFSVDCLQHSDSRIEEAAAGCELVVVCLDSSFPDPVATCAKLRTISVGLAILALAEGLPPSVQLALLRADVDQCVTHGCTLEELVERACLVIRRNETLQSRRLEAGDVYVDDDEQRVYACGVPLDLTSREFAVLRHLVAKAGRIATRSELRAAIWHAREPLESNVIEVLVGRVRRKLGSAASQLRTLRGRGYTLSVDSAVKREVTSPSFPVADE